MITYVDTVLVSNTGVQVQADTEATFADNLKNAAKGSFVLMGGADEKSLILSSSIGTQVPSGFNCIKVGIVTAESKNANGVRVPVVKWSDVINKDEVKSAVFTIGTTNQETEDVVKFSLSTESGASDKWSEFASEGGKEVVLRITYKGNHEPRYRKWTDTYSVIVSSGDSFAAVAQKLVNAVNKDAKRQKVSAKVESGALVLEALPINDDNSSESINWKDKLRFSATMYYTDPQATGFASHNKYAVPAVVMQKTPGKNPVTSGKAARDAESKALGYQGILNRGQGTWPIIKPAIEADINKIYSVATIEYEPLYRAADDVHRKAKKTLTIYVDASVESNFASAIVNWANA